MSDRIDTSLDNCGCCGAEPAPPLRYNRPGLPALSYRAGTYATFFRRMLARLGRFTLPEGDFSGTRPLAALSTRDLDDPAVALLDASAIVAEVLTFYQERIANEGFMGTATERRSVLELARAIGYELSPGVAASVHLAFTVEDAPGAPGLAEIPAGLKVQSVPPQDQLPQMFETSTAITTRAEWNALRPRLTWPQQLSTATNQVYLQGTATNLKIGDRLLLIDDGSSQKLAAVREVEMQPEQKRTRVLLDGTVTPPFPPPQLPPGKLEIDIQVEFKDTAIDTYIRKKKWTDRDLNAFLTFNRWDRKELLTYLAKDRQQHPQTTGNIYALRTTVGIFGHNAPAHKSLPSGAAITSDYGENWDDPSWEIWKDQQAADTTTYYSEPDIFLERTVPGLLPDSWVVLQKDATTYEYYKIDSVIEKSLGAFALSGKSTGLILKQPSDASLNDNDTDKPPTYLVRSTSVHLQSEELELTELPITADLAADPADPTKSDLLELDGLVLGLQIGQAVALSGERADAPGVNAREVLIIKDITHDGGFTKLTFVDGRQYPYRRETVTINANVVSATHGETLTEILGNGNGAQANQRFTLRKPPLTYTRAATPGGSASTMRLRVNDLLWSEQSSLYPLGRNDQGYIIRLDDAGKATVIFGDGDKGARLPSGINNVVATYRSGIGLAGQVEASSLTMLQTKPLGVRSVTNPLPASGAGDPEKLDRARANAPLTVRTLDRIVSCDDYEDFARGFAGIGKAQAVELWKDEAHFVHLTLAGANGKPITDAEFLKNFHQALDAMRDPAQKVRVQTFDLHLFNLVGNVAVDGRYVTEKVFTAIAAGLAETFSFARRTFGQVVTAAEVMTAIQKVAGVVYVDLDSLYLSEESPDHKQILPANSAYVKNGAIQLASLLLINAPGIALQEVKV